MGFIESFENGVKETIEEYKLITPGEKVVVACSGGKDSTTALYILKKLGYDVEALTIDLHIGDYSKRCLEALKESCKDFGVELHVTTFREEYGCSVCYIRSVLKEKHQLKSCSVCGVIRRGLINRKARELGANKTATGHNLDDEAQTVLMNFLQGDISRLAKMGPTVGVLADKKFVLRIKPLFFSREDDIREYSKLKGFHVVYDPCPCSVDTFRTSMRQALREFGEDAPAVKENLVRGALEILPELREHFKTEKGMKYCEKCGEPTNRDICKNCELFAKMRD